jgi:hypothetical protein
MYGRKIKDKVKVHNPCKVLKSNRLAESSEWTIESLTME